MKKKKEHIYCDYCSKPHEIEREHAVSVKEAIGSQMDAAGGTESVFLNFDLCPAAASELLGKLVKENREMADRIKARISRATLD